jgi:hypothetical protein
VDVPTVGDDRRVATRGEVAAALDNLRAVEKAWRLSGDPLAHRVVTACTIGPQLLRYESLRVPVRWVEELLRVAQVLKNPAAYDAVRQRSALRSLNELLTDVKDIVLQTEGPPASLIDALDRNSLLDRVEDSVERAEAIESHVRNLAGPIATGTLADSYQARALAEERMSDRLRVFAVLIIVATGTAVALLPFGSQFTLVDALHRLAFSVPAVLLAGYLARESSQHRFVARNFRAAELRFRALFPFADSLPEEERAVFLKKVGEVLFTTVESHPGDPGKGQGLPLEQFESLLARVAEIVRAQRP